MSALAPARSYSATDVRRITGITYRQLDHWCRTFGFVPSIADTSGIGSPRLFSRADVARCLAVRAFLDAGLLIGAVGYMLSDTALDLYLADVEEGTALVHTVDGAFVYPPGSSISIEVGTAATIVWPAWHRLDP